MISRGTGSNPRGRATEPGLHVALILGIIFVMGVIPTGGLEASAGATAGSPLFSLIMEPEAMDTQRSAMEQWLLDLGFVYDETLGRVRNPFDFPRGEADPALKECFVALGGESDHSNRRLIVGPAGSGKTAQLIMLTEDVKPNTLTFYQSAVTLHAIVDDIFHAPAVKKSLATYGSANVVLDIDDDEITDPQIITLILEKTNTELQRQRGISFYIALPEKYRFVAERYDPLKICWSVQQLAQLLRQRLLWASGGKCDDLARICAENVKGPHERLAAQAQTPRHLFELGQYLFHAHLITALPESEIRLQENDWNLLLAYTQFKQPKRSEQPVPVSETRAMDPQFSMTQQLEELRELLRKLDDIQLETFLLNYCPVVYDEISDGMRHDKKIYLLLEYCYHNPEKTQNMIASVAKYVQEINAGG